MSMQDEDIYLKIRYNYVVNIKKIESFSKELLNLNYNKVLFDYIEKYINDLNQDMYSKNNISKTYEVEKNLLNKNKHLNLEILFKAFNKLFSKKISEKTFNKLSLNNKKEVLEKKISNIKLEKSTKKNRSNYKVLINKLSTVELILFIEYTINFIQNNIN